MSDAVTPYAGLTKPTVGADSGSWGTLLNGDLDTIDAFLRNIVPAGTSFDWRGLATTAPTGFLFEDGQAYSRTTYSALFSAITISVTGNTTSGSPTISSLSADLTAQINTGIPLSGPGIPAGATVSAVTSNSITMSANATATGTGVSITVAPHGVGDGSTTFNVPDSRDKFSVGAGGAYKVSATGGATSFTPTITVTNGATALTQAQLPNCSFTVTDTGHSHLTTEAAHTHTDTGHNHTQDPNTYYNAAGATFGAGGGNITAPGGVVTGTGNANLTSVKTNLTINSATTGITVASGGSGATHTHTNSAVSNAVPTLPPYMAVRRIIKT